MTLRAKPYSIGHEWAPELGMRINEMFEILFTDLNDVDLRTGVITLTSIPSALIGKIIISTGMLTPPVWSPFIFVISQDPSIANFNIGQELLPVYTTGHDNFFIGLHAGTLVTSGGGNLGIGHSALASLVDGINNCAIGWDSQLVNVSGQDNVSLGEDALKFCVGNNNTGLGYAAGYGNSGSHNIAIGTASLYASAASLYNIAIGDNALLLNTGNQNLAIGYNALTALVTGANNVAIGYQAGLACVGINNVFLGSNAGLGNTGSHNFGIGVGTLAGAGNGSYNVCVGENALNNLTTVNDNVAIGYAALQFDVTGPQNTAVGNYAGNHLLGTSNVCLGYAAGYYETGANKLFIDNTTRASAADAYVKALIYGIFASTPTAQSLVVNAVLTTNQPNIGTTSTDGYVLANATPATAGVPVQQSPRFRFNSQVWNTTAVAATNTNDFWIESVPVSGGTPSGLLKIGKSLNGGATTFPWTLDSAGNCTILGYLFTGNNVYIATGNSLVFNGRSIIGSAQDGKLNVSNNAMTTGVGLDFTTDALLKIRTSAQTGDGNISFATYTHSAAEVDKTYQIYTPLTGTTITMAAGQSRAIVNPAGLIAALTITLPPSPVDGQVTGFSFTQAVTVLTVNAPAGATVVAPLTSAAIDTTQRFLYQASSTSWFPAP